MNCLVMTLPTVVVSGFDAPVLPDDDHISQQAGGWWVSYGPLVGQSYPVRALLWQKTVGLYIVFGDDLDKIGPGQTLPNYAKTNRWDEFRVKGTITDTNGTRPIDDYPTQIKGIIPNTPASDLSPWHLAGGITADRAWPSIPSNIGPDDLAAVIHNKPTAVMTP